MRRFLVFLFSAVAFFAFGYGFTEGTLHAIDRQQAYDERQQLIRCQDGYQRDCKIIVSRQIAEGR